MNKEVLFYFVSDMHISSSPSILRSVEKDWYYAQARPLIELYNACSKAEVPLVIAGDIFDRWDANAETINFVLDNLPKIVYAVPGQHDLPYHSLRDINKCAFGTLLKSGKVNLLYDDTPTDILGSNINLYGFAWRVPFSKPKNSRKFNIAVAHKYIWKSGKGHEKAKLTEIAYRTAGDIKDYQMAIFGDNHAGFRWEKDSSLPVIMNNGTMLIRKKDELKYKPRYGVVYLENNAIHSDFIYFDTSKDLYCTSEEVQKLETEDEEIQRFIDSLNQSVDGFINYKDVVMDYLKKYQVSFGALKVIKKTLAKYESV